MKEYQYEINGQSYAVTIVDATKDSAVVEVNGTEYKVGIKDASSSAGAKPARPTPAARKQTAKKKKSKKPNLQMEDGVVCSPMPGVILKILVEVGEPVDEGESILVIEAMKMENEIKAPVTGTIEKIYVEEGNSVNTGDGLFAIKE